MSVRSREDSLLETLKNPYRENFSLTHTTSMAGPVRQPDSSSDRTAVPDQRDLGPGLEIQSDTFQKTADLHGSAATVSSTARRTTTNDSLKRQDHAALEPTDQFDKFILYCSAAFNQIEDSLLLSPHHPPATGDSCLARGIVLTARGCI